MASMNKQASKGKTPVMTVTRSQKQDFEAQFHIEPDPPPLPPPPPPIPAGVLTWEQFSDIARTFGGIDIPSISFADFLQSTDTAHEYNLTMPANGMSVALPMPATDELTLFAIAATFDANNRSPIQACLSNLPHDYSKGLVKMLISGSSTKLITNVPDSWLAPPGHSIRVVNSGTTYYMNLRFTDGRHGHVRLNPAGRIGS